MSRRERITLGAIATAGVLTLALTGNPGPPYDDGPTSLDGRWHECGLVTEQGVTENLREYAARCWPTTTEN